LVDKALIGRKLQRIEGYLKQIRMKKDPGVKSFIIDPDLQSIILFNLIQAVQTCIDIGSHIISDAEWETPSTQAEIFEILARKKVITIPTQKKLIRMVGFRNRIVHEYEKTDMKIVHAVWKRHIGDIETFCKAVAVKYKL